MKNEKSPVPPDAYIHSRYLAFIQSCHPEIFQPFTGAMKNETQEEKRDRIIKRLKELENSSDTEIVHLEADRLLLELIDDSEISDIFNNLEKWYA